MGKGNPYHDPKNGEFTSGPGGVSISPSTKKVAAKISGTGGYRDDTGKMIPFKSFEQAGREARRKRNGFFK